VPIIAKIMLLSGLQLSYNYNALNVNNVPNYFSSNHDVM